MYEVSVTTIQTTNLTDILHPEETLLWSGNPCSGRKTFQFVGEEPVIHLCIIVGCLAMWSSLIFIAQVRQDIAVLTFGAVTVFFVLLSCYIAMKRKFILNKLAYFITDKRAIVLRSGHNWRVASKLYIISCPHSLKYPYEIISSRPYPSLQIGVLLSGELVQPLGFGISHPGHPILWNSLFPPVMFDYIDNATELRELILSCAMNRKDQ